MRIAYLDCASGISGDMTLAAMVDAGVELAALQAGIDSLGLPGCKLVATEVKKRGFRATQITVEHPPEHAHRHLHHIVDMIDGSTLTPPQRDLAKRIFQYIAEAEAKVHGTTIEKIHFHEVGAVDSIADVVGAATGWDLLDVEAVVCSPIPTGTGFVEIAHGRCAIPAPATAEILKGVPLADLPVEGELTTPTGAAIVRAVARRHGPLPAMRIETIGYGAGQADFPQPNILRLLVGEQVATTGEPTDLENMTQHVESITMLQTNIDDSSGEIIGHCFDRLFEAGALDVTITPVQMKKNRPGVCLTVLMHHDMSDELTNLLLSETSTLGVRRQIVERVVWARQPSQVGTAYGTIRGMIVTGAGVTAFCPEFESSRAAAKQHNVPLQTVNAAATAAYTEANK